LQGRVLAMTGGLALVARPPFGETEVRERAR
jgi:hypothetical protein